jgi:hypothetical protein
VSFAAVVVVTASIVGALCELARIIAPGVFAVFGTRVSTLRPMLAASYLAVAALVVLMVHMRLVPNEVRRMSGRCCERLRPQGSTRVSPARPHMPAARSLRRPGTGSRADPRRHPDSTRRPHLPGRPHPRATAPTCVATGAGRAVRTWRVIRTRAQRFHGRGVVGPPAVDRAGLRSDP